MAAVPVLKLFASEDSFAEFQNQYDAMEAQVEEMLKSSPELAGVEESWNMEASERVDKNVTAGDDSNGGAERGKSSGIRVEEIRIGHDGKNP